MKIFVVFAACVLSYTIGFAQSSNKGLETYLGFGATYNSYSNLSSAFKIAGLPSVPKFNPGVMAEEDFRFTNLLIGLNANFNTYQKKSGNYNSSMRTFNEEINVGYNLINTKKFHLAPQAGIGLYTSASNVTQRRGIDSFNNVLAGKNAIDINQASGMLDFCLKFDFADYAKDKSDASIIKLGYRYGLSNRGWGIDISNNSTISNSPKDRLRQIYLMLCLGMSRLKMHT